MALYTPDLDFEKRLLKALGLEDMHDITKIMITFNTGEPTIIDIERVVLNKKLSERGFETIFETYKLEKMNKTHAR